jgi:hypothetical protein
VNTGKLMLIAKVDLVKIGTVNSGLPEWFREPAH